MLYIPSKIKVGYNNRNDTYTGKLAYVIYYGEDGKLRKQTSWQNWRDVSLGDNDYDNVPTEGFVLNKKVGDYSDYYGHRQAYSRIYDPRGFEFEITIENLLYILEFCSSIKGKGLEGEFVYAWDGKDLILLPVDSNEYKNGLENSTTRNNNQYIKKKDLKIGATYLNINERKLVYMGYLDYYENGYKASDGTIISKTNREKLKIGGKYKIGPFIKVKRFWFYDIDNDSFITYKTINKRLLKEIDSNCYYNYSEIFERIQHNTNYSPINEDKVDYIRLSKEEIKEILDSFNGNYVIYFYTDPSTIRKFNDCINSQCYIEIKKYNNELYYNRISNKITIDELYEKKVYRVKKYLMNGNLFSDKNFERAYRWC